MQLIQYSTQKRLLLVNHINQMQLIQYSTQKRLLLVNHINQMWKEERTFVIQVKQQVSLEKIVKITILTLLVKQISSQPLIRISY